MMVSLDNLFFNRNEAIMSRFIHSGASGSS